MEHSDSLELTFDVPSATVRFDIHGFNGFEAVSELFEYRLFLHGPVAEEPSFDEILGKEATVRLRVPGQRQRHIHGVIFELWETGRDERHRYFEALLVPPAAWLDLDEGYRAFQNKTLNELLEIYLDTIPHRFVLHEAPCPRHYAIRYAESTWNHIVRLLEDDGVDYHFAHLDGSCAIVFTDDSTLAPLLPDHPTMPLNRDAPSPHVSSWESTQRLTPWKIAIDDYHAESPDANLLQRHQLAPTVRLGQAATRLDFPKFADAELELREHFAHRFRQATTWIENDPYGLEGMGPAKDRLARVRLEQAASDALRSVGVCSHIGMLPGHVFTLTEAGAGSGDYYITRIDHEVRLPLEAASGAAADATAYSCRFECVPRSFRYRKPRTARRPVVAGVESATVVAGADDEITANDLGSVKVRFHWDEAQGESACWVRVMQSVAGSGHGAVYLPRNGEEVIVAFDDGDPERPFVLGSVFNARHRPPVDATAARRLQGYWAGSLGGERDNVSQFTFDHRLGEEKVTVRSERDADFLSEQDYSLVAGEQMTINVGYPIGNADLSGSGAGGGSDDSSGNYTLDVAGDASETFGANFTQTVGGNYKLHIKGSATFETVGAHTIETASPTLVVSGAVTHVDSSHSRLAVGLGRFDINIGFWWTELYVTAWAAKLHAAYYRRSIFRFATSSSATSIVNASFQRYGEYLGLYLLGQFETSVDIQKREILRQRTVAGGGITTGVVYQK